MTESFDSLVRAEIILLHDRVTELEREFEDARTYGEPSDVHRLAPLLDEARERWGDASTMPALAEAATALYYREGEGWHGLDRCQGALDHLLYRHGGDGMGFLEVVEASPTRITLVGETWWAVPIDAREGGNLVEATFTFDPNPRAVSGIVVRAGETVGDGPRNRPETDEQWAIVIRAP